MLKRKKGNTGTPIRFLMIDSLGHLLGKEGLTPTVSILNDNTEIFSPAAGTVSELSFGWYKYSPTLEEVNTLGLLILHAEAVGADPAEEREQIVAYDPNDTVTLGLTSLPSVVFGDDAGLASFQNQIYVLEGQADQKKYVTNKREVVLDGADYYLVYYENDNTTIKDKQKLEKFGGGSIAASIVNSQTPSIVHKSSI